MQNRWFFLVGVLLAGVGCGVNPPAVETPVSVNGKITAPGGKPVGNVTLNLQPLENGYSKEVPVKPDGSFTVEATPGKYAYYFTPKRGAKATPSDLAGYVAPSLERTIVVASEQAVDITLP